jgi:small-conductance mechanosensitive channel
MLNAALAYLNSLSPLLFEWTLAALIAFAVSFIAVLIAVTLVRRLPLHPPGIAWVRRFVVPFAIFLFLLIARSERLSHEWLVNQGLESWSKVGIVVSVYWFLIHLVRFWKTYFRRLFDISVEDNLDNRMQQTRLQFVEKLIMIVLTVVAGGSILVCFDSAREFGTSLLASAGVAGLVLGFASQKMVANLLAGFQIAFSQPIRLDDAVVIDGEWGWVEEITLTYVVVRIWDLRRLIVPLSRLLEQPFQNWTRTESKLIGSVFLKVSHLVSVEGVRQELDKILARTQLWDNQVKVVQVTDSAEHSMELRILVSARNSSRAFDLRCFVREEMIKYLVALDPANIGPLRIKDMNRQDS